MPDMHIKGYILQLIERNGSMWDYDVAAHVMATYGLSGDYWHGTVRLTLTDLYSSGLLDETECQVGAVAGEERLQAKFAVNAFGRERMAQTGLLGGIR